MGLALTAAGLILLIIWQQREQRRAESLSHLGRLANALLLYTQDWDGCPPVPAERQGDGSWHLWPDRLRGYIGSESLLSCPANPVPADPKSLRHPTHGYSVATSYALNRRVAGVFDPGPFPLENLELPSQTALFVEAGPLRRDPRHPYHASALPLAVLDYGDTCDRVQGLSPYPSLYGGRMAVVAMDGHALTVHVAHYGPEDGPHDPVFGRLGSAIYNWNGGYPNGQTDQPRHE